MAERDEDSEEEIIEEIAEEEWDWDNESGDLSDVGPNFLNEEAECKALFSDSFFPSVIEALESDKNLGFDFNGTITQLKLTFHQTIILINYIRAMVAEKKSIIDGKQFETLEALITYMKENDQFNKLSKEMGFWKEEKYYVPVIQDDPLLCGFDMDLVAEDEVSPEEIEQQRKDQEIEIESLVHFGNVLKQYHGIDLDTLRKEDQ